MADTATGIIYQKMPLHTHTHTHNRSGCFLISAMAHLLVTHSSKEEFKTKWRIEDEEHYAYISRKIGRLTNTPTVRKKTIIAKMHGRRHRLSTLPTRGRKWLISRPTTIGKINAAICIICKQASELYFRTTVC